MTSRQNYDYFVSRLPEYMETHPNEFVVIVEGQDKGFYKTFDDAYRDTIKKHEPGTFIIQECISQEVQNICCSPLMW